MNIPQTWFMAVNILIAAILLFCIIKGFVDGFLYGVINLVFLLLSVIAAWFVSPILSSRISIVNIKLDEIPFLDLSSINALGNTIVWFLIVLITLNLAFILIKPLLKKISKLPVIGLFNRLLGGVMGCIYGYFIILGLSLLLMTPVFNNGAEVKQGTILKYTDTISQEATKFIVQNIDISNVKIDMDETSIENARDAFASWLVSIGVLDA